MPKQGTRVEVNTFVRGLITEASPLNFPANASMDEVNFELKRDGTRKRRLGMDFEDNYSTHWAFAIGETQFTGAVTTFVWEAAGDDVNLNMLVVQTGNVLKFHRMDGPNLSGQPQLFGICPIKEFPAESNWCLTSANGTLVVASGGTKVALVRFIRDGNVINFTYELVPLMVRDVWGLQESANQESDPALRPDTLTKEHEYNLCNQGWGIPRRNKSNFLVDPATQYKNDLGKYPSNTETVWTGLQYQPVDNDKDPYERLYTNLYEDRIALDLAASKGYFILELHNRGASRKAQMTKNNAKYVAMPEGKDYNTDSMNSGASIVTTYAGRVFYSGFSGEVIGGDDRSPSLSDFVFFSKLIKNDPDINCCYQEGDPSSRDNSDLLETDGGFLRVSGAKNIISMVPVGRHLAILASNGVWTVSGGSDYGFSATNYRVDKVTSFGCVSGNSICEINGDLMYWGAESIYQLGYDQAGMMSAKDFSAASINTFYENIPIDAKVASTGVFDAINKKIRWLYRLKNAAGGYDTSELVFDTLLGSFYRHQVNRYGDTELVDLVYYQTTGVKYLVITPTNNGFVQISYTFADYKNRMFKDWQTTDGVGVDAKAYMLTGAFTANDSGIVKQSPYLTLHFKRTETTTDADGVPLNQSSCLMRCQWEWSNDPKSHKFTDLVETYRYRLAHFAMPGEDYSNGFDTIITKNKLRGRGKALSLYFETSPGKDCQLLGWNLTINGNAIT